jgi:hypothetical protein
MKSILKLKYLFFLLFNVFVISACDNTAELISKAESGDRFSQYVLANNYYESGKYDKAAFWYYKSAPEDYSSRDSLAYMLFYGKGIKKDLLKAYIYLDGEKGLNMKLEERVAFEVTGKYLSDKDIEDLNKREKFRIALCNSLSDIETKRAGSVTAGKCFPSPFTDSIDLSVGRFTIKIPYWWTVLSDNERDQAKQEAMEGIVGMMSNYSSQTFSNIGQFGIEDFEAVKLGYKSGWFIILTLKIPAQNDYYKTIEKQNKEKFDWGKERGVFKTIIENGPITVGDKTLMKTILETEHTNGGKLITLYYWTPEEPSLVTQIIVIQNWDHPLITDDIENVIKSLKVSNSIK